MQEDLPEGEPFEDGAPMPPMGLRPNLRMRRMSMRPFLPGGMPMPYMLPPPQAMMMGMTMPRAMMPMGPRMMRPRMPRPRMPPDGMFIPVPGAKMHPHGIKEYWDLDDPRNNSR